ncbi:MAG: Fe-S cluster assembly ATPase SufC [Candidatus Kapabacteria bacterium]|nr:Fe-S cluster assembly ATPase SufC [Candidatus Kapabacteria bacterium]
MALLKVENLKANINGTEILHGLNLTVNAGEVHAIMGPNGSGKSTFASVLAGKEEYEVTNGRVEFFGKNLLDMSIEDRAREGLFLAFQYPVEIPGVSNANFIKSSLNEIRKYRGLVPLDAMDFLQLMRERAKLVEIEQSFLSRSVNEGFSGGEKKKNEIFQMAMLEPKLSIMDETDSGLDIDALKVVSNGVNKLRNSENAFIVITHYQRLLDYIVPDFVHVLFEGRIVKTGGKELAFELEEKGYDWLKDHVNEL